VKETKLVEIPISAINTKYIAQNKFVLESQQHGDFLIEAMAEAIDEGCQFLEPICCQEDEDSDCYLVDGLDVYAAHQKAGKAFIQVELKQDSPDYYIRLINDNQKPLRNFCDSIQKKKKSYLEKFIEYLKQQPQHKQQNWSEGTCACLFGYAASSISRSFKRQSYNAPTQVRARKRDFLINIEVIQNSNLKQGFRWESINPDQFEQLVYAVVEAHQPYEILRTSGSGGKGKDIIAKFRTTGHLNEEYDEIYHIEVKHSEVNRQVSLDQIETALKWVSVEKPNCFVLTVSSQLSSGTRDWLEAWKKNHTDVRVVTWQRDEIENLILGIDKVCEKAIEMKLLPKSMRSVSSSDAE
jgi:hypothetical protein